MRITLILVCVAVLTSCAGYCIQDEAKDKEGYVVYEPWPHLLRTATTNKEGAVIGYTFAVIYLPNRGRPYRVTSWSGLGKADFKFDFANGWMLTGFHDKGDNTEILKALKDLVPAVPTIEFVAGDPPPPVLYRMEFDDCGRICGLTPIEVGPNSLRCAVRSDCCPPRAAGSVRPSGVPAPSMVGAPAPK